MILFSPRISPMSDITIYHPEPNKVVHSFFIACGSARRGLLSLRGELVNRDHPGPPIKGRVLIPPPYWAIAFQDLQAGNKDRWQLRVWKWLLPWTLRTVDITGIAPDVFPDISSSYPTDNATPCPTYSAYGTKIAAVTITYMDMKNSSGNKTHGTLVSGLGNTQWGAQFDTLPSGGNPYTLVWTGDDNGTQVTDGLLASNLRVKVSCP
jgi:hypothetical protein